MILISSTAIQKISFVLIVFFSALTLIGCDSETVHVGGSCVECHLNVADNSHNFACTVCHKGNDTFQEQHKAHKDLITQPAHPENMDITCNQCHEKQVTNIKQSPHYTLKDYSNSIRSAFGNNEQVENFTLTPIVEFPQDIGELADDMLRRRCYRCHLFSSGDKYDATIHGTGCAACHLSYKNTYLESHTFLSSPTDIQCLSCHYGNRVGFDYHGRSEHDFNEEYRTPYTVESTTDRPYGVDFHDLAPDIHQQAGMVCVDCHGKSELMAQEHHVIKTRCRDCHEESAIGNSKDSRISEGDKGTYTFTSTHSGKHLPLPIMIHPAHSRYKDVACQACHGQWSFIDRETHLLRSDLDEYYHWDRLTVQGSYEVEHFLENNLDFDKEELPPESSDKITGKMRSGVWYKGYTERRWEWPIIGRDSTGNISVMRPSLDIYLSWIDEDENVLFDSVSPANIMKLQPYTPHTTGPAGMFFEQRIKDFLATESDNK